MKNYFFICIPVLLLFVLSCKKDTTTDDPAGTPLPVVAPSDTSQFYALFSCLNIYAKNSGSYTANGTQAFAYYSSEPITNETYVAANLQDIGSVTLNNVLFKNKNNVTNFYYNDTSLTSFTLPHNWVVGSSAAISSFSFSNISTLPTFTASSNLPDSISISSGFTVAINHVIDCNLIRVILLGGTGSISNPNKLISGNDSLIKFSADDLQGITATNTGYLSVQFYRDNYRNIGGKRINFRTGLNYTNATFKIKP